MKIGDIVFHVNDPERMQIKSFNGIFVTCELIDRAEIYLPKGKFKPVVICNILNIRTENQLTLF
jgi:hypothetical protein